MPSCLQLIIRGVFNFYLSSSLSYLDIDIFVQQPPFKPSVGPVAVTCSQVMHIAFCIL